MRCPTILYKFSIFMQTYETAGLEFSVITKIARIWHFSWKGCDVLRGGNKTTGRVK